MYHSTEVESRTQGSRPRTQKNLRPRTALPRTDTLKAKGRNAQGQGQGPKTQAQVLFFSEIFPEFSGVFRLNFNGKNNCAVLEPRKAIFENLILRGQSQELDL